MNAVELLLQPFETKVTEQKKVSLAEGSKAFYALRTQAKKNGIQNMTLNEINAEIRAYRKGQ